MPTPSTQNGEPVGPVQMAQYLAAKARRERLGAYGHLPVERKFDVRSPSRVAPTAQAARSFYLERKDIGQPRNAPTPEIWPSQPPAVFYDEAAPSTRRTRITATSIVQEVYRKHQVTIDEIKGYRRYHKIVVARHEAIIRLHVELKLSSTQIGMRLGRDHTTVIYVLQKYGATDPAIGKAIKAASDEKRETRREMLLRAVAMWGEGKSILQIMESMPVSRSSIEGAIRKSRSEAA